MRMKNGKPIPVGADKGPTGNGIVFYDVGQRKKVTIPNSQVTSIKNANGSYRLTAKSPNTTKAGKEYNLHRHSKTPA